MSSPTRKKRCAEREELELDFISSLPDCVLSSILSLLPIKDAVRTSVLSSHWRHLWKATPLRLDDTYLRPDNPDRDDGPWGHWTRQAVSSIFASHHGPIETLCLSHFNDWTFHPAMELFVESAIQRGSIRQLTLVSKSSVPFSTYYLPLSLLNCHSLHQLSLYGCHFPQPLPPSIFPNLKELRLRSVPLPNDLLRILLSECRSLETLHVFFGSIDPVINISSPRLRKLVFKLSYFNELIIKDAPNLESLMFNFGRYTEKNVKVLDAPKLQLLGFIYAEFQALQLGGTFFDRQTTPSTKVAEMPCRIKMLSSVKTLAIAKEHYLGKTIPDLLRCFPCLQNLYIMKYSGQSGRYYSDKDIWDDQCYFSFLDHLKSVTIKGFSSDQSDVEMLRYLILHGKVLKKVTLLCSIYMSQKLVENIRRQVCIEERASSDLELVFCLEMENVDHFSPWNELIKR
ncbi:F-box/RNI-like/FBD-like domains-containing protein [Rhynchospora pubera]|uniref:F-box/RNI-like/FBD-like domains-containing protein n=1 Tax=Rhynchospora pubera TaxID=906938 RepID=A0AAV8EB43_9POAL|nr:F-box/RNI-like/FBD-like domains-containing protein [Rhynchospora pubera]